MYILNKISHRVRSCIRRYNNLKTIYDYPSTNNNWIKYPKQVLGGKDDGIFFDPFVIKLDCKFIMYVSHRNTRSIVRCESFDGVHWSVPKTALTNLPYSMWEANVNRASVVKTTDGWYMWYTGIGNDIAQIGLAFSDDGISFNRYDSNPVIIPTSEWEKKAVMNPCVMWDDKECLFKMWYSAGEKYEPDVICYATSKDGIVWNKYDGNPVLTRGNKDFEKAKVGGCDVIRYKSKYLMFYIGYQNIDNARICQAISSDGINWKRFKKNPIISPSRKSWDAHAVYKPSVIYLKNENKWYMWYNGRNRCQECIGLATKEGQNFK